jgi:colanic acid/amylovoran biosynthesis glycosyltransferase
VVHWRHQLGLDDVVHLVGAASPGEVAHHYLWADVVLHSAVTEGFGNVAIEAQAQGVPVVCTDAGGLSENVQDGVTGLVVPRRNPEALRDALERIATVPGLHQRLSGAGPSRVDRLFRLDHQLDAWERFYEDALRKRHGHP